MIILHLSLFAHLRKIPSLKIPSNLVVFSPPEEHWSSTPFLNRDRILASVAKRSIIPKRLHHINSFLICILKQYNVCNLVHNHKISLAKSTKLMQYQIEFVCCLLCRFCCLLPKDDLLTSSIIYLSDIDVEHVGPNNDAEHGG